jgi:hypothetical protein
MRIVARDFPMDAPPPGFLRSILKESVAPEMPFSTDTVKDLFVSPSLNVSVPIVWI